MRNILFTLSVLFLSTNIVNASDVSYCSEVGRWAEASTQVYLINNNILQRDNIDYEKISISLISEEKIGEDLYKQVHSIKYQTKDDKEVSVISTNNASSEECSMSAVDVQIVK